MAKQPEEDKKIILRFIMSVQTERTLKQIRKLKRKEKDMDKRTDYWNCYHITKIGGRHLRSDLLCQDRISYKCEDEKQVIGLVDGSGNTDLNAIAGEKVVGVVTDFLLKEYENCMRWSRTVINTTLLNRIGSEIEKISWRYGVPVSELKSTVMAVCIDHRTDTYCAVHLGDGIIIGIQNNDTPITISYPVNGYKQNQTYLTTSEEAVKKMKVFRGRLSDLKAFSVCSDGIYDGEVDEKVIWKRYEKFDPLGMFMENREDDQAMIILQRK